MDDEKNRKRNPSEQIFDGCFHVSAYLCKELLIPLTNEAFRMNIPGDAGVDHRSELQTIQGKDGKFRKRVMDILVSFRGVPWLDENTRFHFECESRAGNIILRIVEYALLEGIKSPEKAEDGFVDVHILRSAVIYLQSNRDTPKETRIRLHTPGGDLEYPVPAIRLSDYSQDEIFEKELFILLPFYLLRFRDKRGKIRKGMTAALEKMENSLKAAIDTKTIAAETAERISRQLREMEEYLLNYSNKEEKNMDNKWEKDWYVIDDPQFYVEEGREEGREEGSEKRLVDQVCKKLRKGKDVEQIADEVEEDVIRVKLICDIARDFAPEYQTEKVFSAVQKESVHA